MCRELRTKDVLEFDIRRNQTYLLGSNLVPVVGSVKLIQFIIKSPRERTSCLKTVKSWSTITDKNSDLFLTSKQSRVHYRQDDQTSQIEVVRFTENDPDKIGILISFQAQSP